VESILALLQKSGIFNAEDSGELNVDFLNIEHRWGRLLTSSLFLRTLRGPCFSCSHPCRSNASLNQSDSINTRVSSTNRSWDVLCLIDSSVQKRLLDGHLQLLQLHTTHNPVKAMRMLCRKTVIAEIYTNKFCAGLIEAGAESRQKLASSV
jgi:hypothetical protein